MFPAIYRCCSHDACFPRIRGDVPRSLGHFLLLLTFSPHTRGCSFCGRRLVGHDIVFPAYAGMFRFPNQCVKLSVSFPRIRGDVPVTGAVAGDFEAFSPHTRGCSWQAATEGLSSLVFPAYAGMFLANIRISLRESCFPRIRGDVPETASLPNAVAAFSPHTRGCSRANR